MDIFLAYSTSDITSRKNVCCELKMAAILKISKYKSQLQFDLRYEKIVPNYAKKIFHGDDIIDDVTGWPQSFPLFSPGLTKIHEHTHHEYTTSRKLSWGARKVQLNQPCHR